jgi:hypothetical protein
VSSDLAPKVAEMNELEGTVPAARSSPAWNLVAGTITRYVLLIVNIALGVVLMPYTVRHLG